MKIELIIQNGDKIYYPIVQDDITWTTERKCCPGELKFSVIPDGVLNIQEGNAVRLKVNDFEVFYGFIFTKKRTKDKIITITAYDQLRYFKNKYTYVYEDKTADEVVKMLVNDFKLNAGTIEDTKYKIPSRVEENSTLFDITQNALDITLENKKEMYVLFDDFGKIALKNITSMQLNTLIDEEAAENYNYSSTIDSNTYNKVKLTYENEESGKRDVYIAQDSSKMNAWGILQYFDVLQDGENGKAKADALLELYNKKTRNLSISNVIGNVKARAGCLIPVMLNLGDINVKNMMLIEKCKHTFKESEHFMDLTLRGGEFIA